MSKEIIEKYLNQNPKNIAGLFNWMMMPGLNLSTIQVTELNVTNLNIYQTTRAIVEKIKNASSMVSSDSLSTEFFYWMLKFEVDTKNLNIKQFPAVRLSEYKASISWAERVKNSKNLFTKQDNIDLITWMLRCKNLAGAFNWMMRSDVNIKKENSFTKQSDQLGSKDFPENLQLIFQQTRDLAKKLKEGTLAEKDREKCLQWMEKVKLGDLESFSSSSQGKEKLPEKTPAEALFSTIKITAVNAAEEAEKNKNSLTLINNSAASTFSRLNTTNAPLPILQQLKKDTITLASIEANLPMLQSILFNPECLLYLIQNNKKEFLGKAMGYYLAQRRTNEKSLTSNDFENLANALKGQTDSIKKNRKFILSELIKLDDSRKFVAPLCVELKKTFGLTKQINLIASNFSPTWLLALCETPNSDGLLSSIFEQFANSSDATNVFKQLIEKLICDFAKSPDDIDIIEKKLFSFIASSNNKQYHDFSKSLQLAEQYVKAKGDSIQADQSITAILAETNNSDLWNVCLSLLSPKKHVSILFDKLVKTDISQETRTTAEQALISVLKTLSEKNAYTPEVLEILSKKENFYRLKNIFLESNNKIQEDIVTILKNRSLFFGLYKAFNETPPQQDNWNFIVNRCLNLNADVTNDNTKKTKQEEIIRSLGLTNNDRIYIKNSIADNDFEIKHAKKYPHYAADLKKQGFFSKLFGFKVPGQAERIKHYPKGSADILTLRITPEMAHYPLTTDTTGWARLVAGTGSFGFYGMDPDVYKLVNAQSDFFERLQKKDGKKWDPKDGEILKNRRVLFNLYKELNKTTSTANESRWAAVLKYIGLDVTNFSDVEEDKKLELQLTAADFHYLKSEIKNNDFEIQYAKDYPGSWKKPEERTWGEYISWKWFGQSTRNKHYKNHADLATITPELSRYYADIAKNGWDSFAETVPIVTVDAEESNIDDSTNRDSFKSGVSTNSLFDSRNQSIITIKTDDETDNEEIDETKSIASANTKKRGYTRLPTTSRDSSQSIVSRSTSQSTKNSSTFSDTFLAEVENILDFISGDSSALKPIFLNEDEKISSEISTHFQMMSALKETKHEEKTLFLLLRFAFNSLLDNKTLNIIKESIKTEKWIIPSLKTYLKNAENREKLISRYDTFRKKNEHGFSLEATMSEAIKQSDEHHVSLSSNAIMTHDLGVKKILPVSAFDNATQNNVQKKYSSKFNTNLNSALNTKQATQIKQEFINLHTPPPNSEGRADPFNALALYNFVQTLETVQKSQLFMDLYKKDELVLKNLQMGKRLMTDCFLRNLNDQELFTIITPMIPENGKDETPQYTYLADYYKVNRQPFIDSAKQDKANTLTTAYNADKQNTWIPAAKRTGAELMAVYKQLEKVEKITGWINKTKSYSNEQSAFLEKLEAMKDVDAAYNKNKYLKNFCIAMANEDEKIQQAFFSTQLTPTMIQSIGDVLTSFDFLTHNADIPVLKNLLTSIKTYAPENAAGILNAAETLLAAVYDVKLKIFKEICEQVLEPLSAENTSLLH